MNFQELCTSATAAYCCLADKKTKTGRRQVEYDDQDCLMGINPFVSDEARLWSSKSVRLLSKKTQVVTKPHCLLVRDRCTHTMEVIACSVITSEFLGINAGLARAIAIGHDMGHVPFGHSGEHYLAKAMGRKKFCHEVMGVVIAQFIERAGMGLNLTFETLLGMMCHSGNTAREDMSPEAWVVRYCDKFAYLFADYNDLVKRFRFQVPLELESIMNDFGLTQRQRTTTAMIGLALETDEMGKVSFEHSELALKFKRIRELMYECYVRVTEQDPSRLFEPVLNFLSNAKIGDPFLLIALMVDDDILNLATKPMLSIPDIYSTSVGELLPYMEAIGPVDMCDPKLDW